MNNATEDIIFSPGDKRTSSKLHSSTMKKSNTIGIAQSKAVGNFSSSNRFLFRGNEEFHNTVGTKNQIKHNSNEEAQPLFVGSNSKPKKKENSRK